MKNYYDEDGLYIQSLASWNKDLWLDRILTAIKDNQALSPQDKEFLILNDYDPNTGKFNE